MKRRAIKGIGIVLIFVTVCIVIGYCFSYPIELNRVTLPGHIEAFYNRGRSAKEPPTIVLYDGISIGKKEYYLVEIGEDLGTVTLEKGLTGRYKITHLGFGGGDFLDGIVESGQKKYLLFGGRDITAQIAKITVLIDGQSYELYTPKEKDHFLISTEIEHRVEDTHVDRGDITFYNEKGEDITKLYNLSGGGIR